ncbi:uncharacterized protein Dana_GF28198 [Drosophila ananassae]|uniref:DUF4794 domain-containing protein n=1 Tax=Drosophila ananassae TaxID=7217 RepID=A0A0P9AIX3_DROAN|nr:uncharacterized protein LOC26515607 [Drosophila ananassae]KPU77790.1 uncharacterized protein Dana_GF28198 [Drosophila ananassae]
MRLKVLCFLLLAISLNVKADVSQLVRSGNGFVYDVPKVTELELEVSNEFPTGEEFPQDAIPVAPSDAELGQTDVSDPEPEDPVISAASNTKSGSSIHGYKYQKPSRRFKS